MFAQEKTILQPRLSRRCYGNGM